MAKAVAMFILATSFSASAHFVQLIIPSALCCPIAHLLILQFYTTSMKVNHRLHLGPSHSTIFPWQQHSLYVSNLTWITYIFWVIWNTDFMPPVLISYETAFPDISGMFSHSRDNISGNICQVPFALAFSLLPCCSKTHGGGISAFLKRENRPPWMVAENTHFILL